MPFFQEYLYLEHDGKVLLVDEDGKGPEKPQKGRLNILEKKILRFPTKSEVIKMGILWNEKRNNTILLKDTTYNVIIAEPIVDWPEDWAWKDDAISDNCVLPFVRESIYRSIHRIVSKVIMINDNGQVLMAKNSRGFFTGLWTIPGGFVNYGEHPRRSAEREVLEELGIKITIPDQNGEMGKIIEGDDYSIIQQDIFNEEGLNWVSHTYRYRLNLDINSFKIKEGEIEDVRWFEPKDALDNAASLFDQFAIRKCIY